jgi:hypothetical protein
MFDTPTTMHSKPTRAAVCMARSTRHAPLKLSSGSNRFCPSCMYSTGQRVPRASGAMYDGGR